MLINSAAFRKTGAKPNKEVEAGGVVPVLIEALQSTNAIQIYLIDCSGSTSSTVSITLYFFGDDIEGN